MTKEQLKGYRAIKLERDKLAGMLEELEANMYSPKGQKLDGMLHITHLYTLHRSHMPLSE